MTWILKCKEFTLIGDLVDWVNLHKIDKAVIQNIIFDPDFKRYMLLYWI